MKAVSRKESWSLLLGDILMLTLSLWVSLLLRFGELPSGAIFQYHLLPFSILFVIWLFIFFIAGLYEKQTTIFKSRLPGRLLNTQLFNSLLAVMFFYFIPYFEITPKTILFVYLFVSTALIFIWRTYGQKLFGLKVRESAMILGQGSEMMSLQQEVNSNPRYGFQFVASFDLGKINEVDLQKDIIDKIYGDNISVVVIDLQNENIEKDLPHFFNLLFSRVRFVDMNSLYEEIFDRVPVSLLGYNWFLENISLTSNFSYDIFKRAMDIVFSIFFGLISLIFYPFIFLLIKLEDGGEIFIVQNRVGRNNSSIKIHKFRTMSFNDNEETENKKDNKITKVGKFLRNSRLDEIPQLWNILKGDLSLIGPRPELPALAEIYEREVPYYNVRHLIKPGVSGWAQLYHENHPHQGIDTKETKNKLSYDLYYIKNRSLFLDLKIALKTFKTILSQSGK